MSGVILTMNIYDTANKLAQELKQSEEYVNYKLAKEALNLKPELKEQIEKFELDRYDSQVTAMQTGKNDEEKTMKMQQLYIELIENDDAKKFFDAETKFNVLFSDVNKIIGDAIMDVLK